ncbi:MAG: undecaprenyl-diphosphate phosphatase [Alphaproteobacteria bacterium]|nr:undecaprenyl-diphosphate phosphatase [Alphaproteobacteria bacterium]
MFSTWLNALILGLVEGLTEFLPISSTGHMLLMDEILKFQGPPGHVFEIVIQLGAILAVVAAYFPRLWRVLITARSDKNSQRFILAVLIAFLPAMVIGAFAHGFIKGVLFNPTVVAVSFIVGGFLILWIEKHAPEPKIESVETMPLKTALGIGLIQCISMIPGVSRAGATIMGALMLKVERKAAAEFSFFLAIPTMAGAAAYDLYKNYHSLSDGDGLIIASGFIAAFLSALFVVKTFIGFIGRHGFAPFAWYRIAAGIVALGALWLV